MFSVLALVVVGQVSDVPLEREKVRGHFAAAAVVAGGYASSAFIIGGGVQLAAGAVVQDDWIIGVRAHFAYGAGASIGASLGFDHVFGDHFTLGIGAGGIALLGGVAPSTPNVLSMAVVAPVRVSWSPMTRATDQLGRRGLFLGFELSPGYVFGRIVPRGASLATPTSTTVSGQFSVGYAWW